MSPPPEVVFDRYLREHGPRNPHLPRDHPDSRLYRGKEDLRRIPEDIATVLSELQRRLNTLTLPSLVRGRQFSGEPPVFHFDYVDSNIANALAFDYGGFSFIGITTALLSLLMDISNKLSTNLQLKAVLGLQFTPEEQGLFAFMVFQLILLYVFMHEYAHHLFGHVAHLGANSLNLREVEAGVEPGGLDQQACEILADSWAVRQTLGHVFLTPEREHMIEMLKLKETRQPMQDAILFACLMMSICAYFMTRPPVDLKTIDLYTMTHPLQVTRFAITASEAIRWCEKNRDELGAWITKARLMIVTDTVARVVWSEAQEAAWNAQNAFFSSEQGEEYGKRLKEAFELRTGSKVTILRD